VNRPFALALDAAWEARFGQRLEMYTSNDCVVFQLPPEVRGDEVLTLVSSATVEQLLRKRLESSGFFGARFRECAGRALLLPRNRVGERMPLWMNRLRSQKLLSAVLRYEDFPILLETWRTCLVDEFDLESLKQVLAELESGAIHWSEAHTSYLSPMAQHIIWQQTNEYMYTGDEPLAGNVSRLRDDLLSHVVFTPSIRPTVAPDLVEQFELKRQRLAAGYSPDDPRDLVDWVKERLLISAAEWEHLLEAIHKDHGISPEALLESVAGKLVQVVPPAASGPLVVALESLPRIAYGLYGTAVLPRRSVLPDAEVPSSSEEAMAAPEGDHDEVLTGLLGEWLQFYGPVDLEFIGTTLGIDWHRLSLALEDLIDSQKVIMGQLVTAATGEQVCDSENFEVLLRLARRAAVPVFEAKEIEWLPLFLAHYQGVGGPDGDVDDLFSCLEQLRCLPAAAEVWESEFLPARLRTYSASWLDTIMQEGDLRWVGGSSHAVTFCFESDLPLLQEDPGTAAVTQVNGAGSGIARQEDTVKSIFPDALGRYDFSTLVTVTNYSPSELSDRLWAGVWQGRVTNDTYAALRKGIATRFQVSQVLAQPRFRGHRTGRISFSRWKASLPFAGNWFLLPPAQPAEDLLETEERTKDRARILLERYGILFRELLEHESLLFRWGKIFRALRLMELSGEVLAGYFFEGIPGPQFISPRAFQVLQSRLPEKVCWLNATDPASLCGVQLDAIKGGLPKRIPSAHLVYHGTRLVAMSQRNGRTLTFNVPPDDAHLPEYLGFLHHLLSRQFQPLHRIIINTINGEEATSSSYVDALRISFSVMIEGKNVILYRSRVA
jgi:ATP-dependent Lhr-like helicase